MTPAEFESGVEVFAGDGYQPMHDQDDWGDERSW